MILHHLFHVAKIQTIPWEHKGFSLIGKGNSLKAPPSSNGHATTHTPMLSTSNISKGEGYFSFSRYKTTKNTNPAFIYTLFCKVYIAKYGN